MKKCFFIATLLLCPLLLLAQDILLQPGIYTLVDETPVPLKFCYGISSVQGKNTLGVEVAYETYRYRGETSGIEASDTFILVIDPARKEVVKKFSEYNPFVRNMKPARMIIVPLAVNPENQCREYYPGMKLEGVNVQERPEMKFDWEEIGDNTFKIKVQDLRAGEYAIIFKIAGLQGPDFNAMFGFTITAKNQETL